MIASGKDSNQMGTFSFSNALNYSITQLSEMHNESFTGYFLPLNMTAEQTALFWRIYHIDARHTIVMHDEQQHFAGITRIGVRGKRSWCGGFGIAPAFRGQGASKVLATQMVEEARANDLATLQLEVLTQNSRAIRAYESAGFVIQRQLYGLEIATEALPASSTDTTIKSVAPEKLLARLLQDEKPCWQREPATLIALSVEGFSSPQGDFLVTRSPERVNLQACMLSYDLSNAELAGLLRQIAGAATSIMVNNEPGESPFLARCRDLGFQEKYSQHEMLVEL
jgi:RimJ/RimL family protein N-acetyltransferase